MEFKEITLADREVLGEYLGMWSMDNEMCIRDSHRPGLRWDREENRSLAPAGEIPPAIPPRELGCQVPVGSPEDGRRRLCKRQKGRRHPRGKGEGRHRATGRPAGKASGRCVGIPLGSRRLRLLRPAGPIGNALPGRRRSPG